jgi:hypothetical protein
VNKPPDDNTAKQRLGMTKLAGGWKVLPHRADPFPMRVRLASKPPPAGTPLAHVHSVPLGASKMHQLAASALTAPELVIAGEQRLEDCARRADLVGDRPAVTPEVMLDEAGHGATATPRLPMHEAADHERALGAASATGSGARNTPRWRVELRRKYDEARARKAGFAIEQHIRPARAVESVANVRPDEQSCEPGSTREFALLRVASGVSGGIRKAALAAGIVLMLAVRWSDGQNSGVAQARAEHTAPPATMHVSSILDGEWSHDWSAGRRRKRDKSVSVYRTALPISDCRLELVGRIEQKAIAWIFRARDARNYYVMKLEQTRTGNAWITALVRYAIINGKETVRTQIPVPFVSVGKLVHIRMDIIGNTFTTFLEDQLADIWSDEQLRSGFVGILHDVGERALISGFRVARLG